MMNKLIPIGPHCNCIDKPVQDANNNASDEKFTCPGCGENKPADDFEWCIDCRMKLCGFCILRCHECDKLTCFECADWDGLCVRCSEKAAKNNAATV